MTTAQIDAIIATLQSAIGSGTARVRFEGREVEYKSTKEIIEAISYFQGLRDAAAGTSRIRQIRMYSQKGF